jgi:hypothetical protein
MIKRRWFGALTLLLGACNPSEVRATFEDSRQAILGGEADPAASAVFLLDLRFSNNTASVCSASLVSPKVLLTAAHCVDPVFHGASEVRIEATNKPSAAMLKLSDLITVTRIARHPLWEPSDAESDFDLALLLLEAPPAGAGPLALARTTPTFTSASQVTALGYGRTSAGVDDSGTRKSVKVTVTQTTSTLLEFGVEGSVGICSGDSGGPLVWAAPPSGTTTIVGVHSRVRSTNCGTGTDIRVDRQTAFIDAFLAANDPASCAQDLRCVASCATPDPDCPTSCATDGVCKSECGATDSDCAHCAQDDVCTEATCASVDPDCARCQADGACSSARCPTADPDCGACSADGGCDSPPPAASKPTGCGVGPTEDLSLNGLSALYPACAVGLGARLARRRRDRDASAQLDGSSCVLR